MSDGPAMARGLGHDLVLGVRRAAIPFVVGIVLLVLAVPAVEDLDSLLRGLGIAALVLGVVIVLATVGWRPKPTE